MSDLNFDNISLNDISVGGQSLAPVSEPIAEPIPEPVSEPTPETTPEPSPTPEPTPAPKQDFKFKDDFIKNVVDYYEKTGDLTPYLQAKLVDFNSMSDEEVMRRSLREQYPDVSEKLFDRLYKQQVVDKYKLDADEYGEEDAELGQELMKAEALKNRQKYIEWQQSFQAPAQEFQAQPDEALQQFQQQVVQNDLTKSLLESKRLALSEGFNFEIPNAEAMVEMTLDNNKFFELFASPEGGIDYAKWYKAVAYSQNPELVEKSLISYGKTLGREEIAKELKNPSTPLGGDVPTENSSDFASGLLQAFVSRGVNK
jgi:hypothetical protein